VELVLTDLCVYLSSRYTEVCPYTHTCPYTDTHTRAPTHTHTHLHLCVYIPWYRRNSHREAVGLDSEGCYLRVPGWTHLAAPFGLLSCITRLYQMRWDIWNCCSVGVPGQAVFHSFQRLFSWPLVSSLDFGTIYPYLDHGGVYRQTVCLSPSLWCMYIYKCIYLLYIFAPRCLWFAPMHYIPNYRLCVGVWNTVDSWTLDVSLCWCWFNRASDFLKSWVISLIQED